MEKIRNIDDLQQFHEKYAKLLAIKKGCCSSSESDSTQIMICGVAGCKSEKSEQIAANIEKELKLHNLEDKVNVSLVGCFGFCAKGPFVKIAPDNVIYHQVTPKDATRIVNEHIVNKKIVEDLLFVDEVTGEKIKTEKRLDFYKKQVKIALRNCGIVDPYKIEEYIGNDGYLALAKCLTTMSSEEVIKQIIDSGLRGRGGGGFSTGLKWKLTREVEDTQKYIVCNADEGDPGAFMDRSILEGDPYSILEAMSIAGYCIGADIGYIYVRMEYPTAIETLKIAIKNAKALGLLGENILGTNFSFNIEIKTGAGAFVCGEETALIHSIEGLRGEPTSKPPYPSVSGLWKHSTAINNVETLANIPVIINKGASWFNSIGTDKAKGTKVFALAGKIKNVGLIEVPMGITLKEIIYEIGGGIKDDKAFKAVQTGGPSGGCIPADLLDLKIDYDNLVEQGSMMGSGGMIVMDEDNCMVDIARFYLDFTKEESCGKCVPCRIGNVRLLDILEKIVSGKAELYDLDTLINLSESIKSTALCGLGQTSPNPILSTIHFFKDEYVKHIVDKKCPAKVCKDLITYQINDKCIGCTLCVRNCPVLCISGNVKEKHQINSSECIKCGACKALCRFGAIDLV